LIRPWLLAVCFVCATLVAAAQARAQPVLVADGGEGTQRGPAAAAGAVIWNHAGDAPRATDPAPAIFVEVLRDAGYDVFRLERPPEGDTIRASTLALVDAGKGLRARGYARIVLAGQSAGGWIAIAAPGVLSSAGLHRSDDRPTTMKKLSVHRQHLTKIVPG
jgi:hypothetical protein